MNLVDYAGIWGFLISLGIFLNSLSRQSFRHRIASFLVAPEPDNGPDVGALVSLAQLSKQFIDNTLISFFGAQPFALRAVLRSTILSVLTVTCLFFVSWYVSGLSFEGFSRPAIQAFSQSPGATVLSILCLLLIDFLSFVQTFLFMRYAFQSSGLLEIVFLAYCDIALSISLFIFSFPVIIGIYIIGNLTHSSQGIYDYSYIMADSSAQLMSSLSTLTAIVRAAPTKLLDPSFDSLGKPGYVLLTTTFAASASTQSPDIKDVGLESGLYLVASFRASNLAQTDQGEALLKAINEVRGWHGHLYDGPLKRYAAKDSWLLEGQIPPQFHFRDITSFEKVNILYSAGFRVAQQFQADLPNSLIHAPSSAIDLHDADSMTARLNMRDEIREIDYHSRFVEVCPDHTSVSIKAPQSVCDNGIIFEIDPKILDLPAQIAFAQTIKIPLYSIVFSSFCVTFIFYICMLLFVFYVSVIRLISVVLPGIFLTIFDIDLIRDNSIAVIFCIGSFFVILIWNLL